MTASQKMAKIAEITAKIKANPMANKEDIRTFYKDVMELVVDYKMPGNLYDFVHNDVDYYRGNRTYTKGVEPFVTEVVAFLSAFPDVVADIEDTIVKADETGGYKLCARIRFRGTNGGASYVGAPTGKSLEEGGLSLHFIYISKVNDKWGAHKLMFADSTEWIEKTMTPD